MPKLLINYIWFTILKVYTFVKSLKDENTITCIDHHGNLFDFLRTRSNNY